jgi:cyclophilin family peptidyl-prolyl cis-trans isomerase
VRWNGVQRTISDRLEAIVKRWLLALCACAVLCLSSCGSGETPIVLIETSMGNIKVKLYQGQAPITVKNFLDYVDKKFYDDTIFHRVKPDFMIQGGGFTKDLKEKRTGYQIQNESYNGLSNKRGTLAMARTSAPDSATAQFFINVVNNDFLDRAKAQDKVGYAVFGEVIEGMDVVDRIKDVKTADIGPMELVPVEPVIIKSIRRVVEEK